MSIAPFPYLDASTALAILAVRCACAGYHQVLSCMSCLQATEVHQHFSQHGLNAVPHLVHCIATTPDQHHGTKQHYKRAASGSGSGSNGDNHHRGAAQSSLSMYSLEVVPRNQLPASYCTISATGVVQVSPPEPVDSCSLQHRYCEKNTPCLSA